MLKSNLIFLYHKSIDLRPQGRVRLIRSPEWKVAIYIVNISIAKLQKVDAEALYQFEHENRSFFEKMVPSRGNDYYIREIFNQRHTQLLEEQRMESCYFYLIKNKLGTIVGRINLVDIDKTLKIGHLGYRVGKIHTGKGIASRAVKLLLDEITMHHIHLVRAKTTTTNLASQKVLENNGFTRLGSSNETFELNGEKLKFVDYEWDNR